MALLQSFPMGGGTLLYEKKIQYKTSAPNSYTESVNIDVSPYSRVVIFDVRRGGSETGWYDYFGEVTVPIAQIDAETTVYKILGGSSAYSTVIISTAKKITSITINAGISSNTLYWTDFLVYGFK